MTALGKVRLEERGGVPVAHLEGEVDLSNVGEITTSILTSIGDAPPGLVTDLSGTAYLDSAGIRMLFELSRRLSREGHDLRVVLPPRAPIHDALSLTELPSVIPLHPTVEEALAAMERTPDQTPERAGHAAPAGSVDPARTPPPRPAPPGGRSGSGTHGRAR